MKEARLVVGRAVLVGDVLERDGLTKPLRPLESRLLRLLAERPGQIVSRIALLDGWPLVTVDDLVPSTRVVDVTVQRARGVLDEIGAGAKITAVRSAGYRLDDQRPIPGRTLSLGDATLDLDHLIVHGPSGDKTLSAMNARLLKILATSEVGVPYQELWQRATGETMLLGSTLRTHITSIRQTLNAVGSRAEIANCRRVSYRLNRPFALSAKVDVPKVTFIQLSILPGIKRPSRGPRQRNARIRLRVAAPPPGQIHILDPIAA